MKKPAKKLSTVELLKMVNRLHEIREEISSLLEEVQDIAQTASVHDGHLQAYFFDQIEEHLYKNNEYIMDMNDVANLLLKKVDEATK